MSPGADILLLIASLWQPTDRTTNIEPPQDIYQEWLESLETGVSLLGISLSPGVDEMPCDGDNDFDLEPADLGVDLSSMINPFFVVFRTNCDKGILSVNERLETQDVTVQPDSPTYPWPSLSVSSLLTIS